MFIGIRNSYCAMCQRALARNEEKPDHRCFLNWNKPSTGMEADGILEGFLNSYQMHGLKYNKLIGINLINYIIIVKYRYLCFLSIRFFRF